jgi:hypothetical protein
MKKLVLIAFLLFIVKMQAQENAISPDGVTKKVMKSEAGEYFGPYFKMNATFGTTTPLGDYQSYSNRFQIPSSTSQTSGFNQEISGRYQFNIDAVYQMKALGAGASFGVFSHEVSNFNFEQTFPLLLEGGEIDGSYFGIGPEYTTAFGQFQLTAAFRGGLLNYSMSNFMASYNGTDVTTPREIFRTDLNPDGKSSLVYASAGIKLNYPIYKGLHLIGRLDYLTTFGNGIDLRDRYARPFDFNDDGSITAGDVDVFINSENIATDVRSIKPQMLNVGIGLQYSFGGLGRKYNPNDISNRRGKGEQYQKNAILAYETSGHRISIEQAENMYTNYNTILKPPIEELQKERRQDTSYRATEYAFVSIKALKYYIAFLDKVEKLNPDQPELSGMIIAFGAYDMDYNPSDEADEVEIIGGENADPKYIGKPDKYGDYRGRQTVFFAPTYYDDDPKLIGKDEIFKHRPFFIIQDQASDNKYKGTYFPVPFLDFVDNNGVGDFRNYAKQFFGGSEFGGPRQKTDLETPIMLIEGENTTLFFNDLNNMPPKGNNN